MNEVRRNNLKPEDPVKGHAEWIPNQLNKEIERGVWYLASCSSDFILRYANGGSRGSDGGGEEEEEDDLWKDILTCMGGPYAELAKQYVGESDGRPMP